MSKFLVSLCYEFDAEDEDDAGEQFVEAIIAHPINAFNDTDVECIGTELALLKSGEPDDEPDAPTDLPAAPSRA